MQPFGELICAYLDGLPGADEVLNDALEESGMLRVALPGTLSQRLAIVLDELISDPVAQRLSLDYARHVARWCEGPLARQVLQTKERELETHTTSAERNATTDCPRAESPQSESPQSESPQSQADGEALLPFQALNSLGWVGEVTPKSSAAWAVWGALLIPLKHVAAAAQRAYSDELNWQVEHVKGLLME